MRPGHGGTPPGLPSRLFNARCLACWQVAGVAALVVASFWSLDLQLAALFSGAYKPKKDERVGVVVCGANTAMDTFSQLFA